MFHYILKVSVTEAEENNNEDDDQEIYDDAISVSFCFCSKLSVIQNFKNITS